MKEESSILTTRQSQLVIETAHNPCYWTGVPLFIKGVNIPHYIICCFPTSNVLVELLFLISHSIKSPSELPDRIYRLLDMKHPHVK